MSDAYGRAENDVERPSFKRQATRGSFAAAGKAVPRGTEAQRARQNLRGNKTSMARPGPRATLRAGRPLHNVPEQQGQPVVVAEEQRSRQTGTETQARKKSLKRARRRRQQGPRLTAPTSPEHGLESGAEGCVCLCIFV